jgi:two-component system CheB/CheR fusion protein
MTHLIDYQTLFGALPERYVVFDVKKPGFTILAASNKYLEVTDKSIDQVVGQKLFTVFPDPSENESHPEGDLRRSLRTVIRTKKPDSTGVIRYDIANKAGELEVRYWQATHYPLFESGKVAAILQSTADITEQLKLDEQLRLANIRLEDAVQSGIMGSWSWNLTTNSVTADKGLADIFGVSEKNALIGVPIETFISSIHEEDFEVTSALIQETIATGNKFEAEYRTVDAKKNIRWVIARGKIERDEAGNPIEFPGVLIDITSRKQAEMQLQESEERLRFITDTMPQLIWVTRPDGYHEYYNKHWYDYTGTEDGTTDGVGWKNLFHPKDQERANEVWQHSLKTGDPYEIKYRLYHAASGEYRWVIGRALPFRNAQGEIVKWYGTCTDIHDSFKELEARRKLEIALNEEKVRLESRVAERTSQLKLTNEGLRDEIKKRQKVERKLREYGEELQRSNKELEEFAYVSSHDLQEPLRKIQAFSDLLVDEYGEALGDGKEYLDRITGSSKRMSTLIEDLLTFSRVTTKQSVLQSIDLNEVMGYVLSDLDDRIEKEKGTVTVQPGLPTVMADETHMRQLFQNLISNALKFHAPDKAPVVEISATKDEDECIITVKDNGIGIEEKYSKKIFAVFQRLNSKTSYEGTGIGLAVCKKIVERYGGTIVVESQLGSGTTFIITLPVE